MARYIVTGNYSSKAFSDMLENPHDRETMARGIVEAAGGTLEGWHITTGPTDVLMIVTVDDVEALLAGLLVGAASGNFSSLQTQRAFSSSEFTAIQQKAAAIKSSYG